MKKQLYRYTMITIGCMLLAISMNGFFIPNKLLSGGLAGFCIILYYLFGWPLSYTNILFNIPLFIIAYKMMSRDYFISGIFGTLIVSVSLGAFQFLTRMTLVHDTLLACIAGGVIHGIGCAMLYRVGGNSGGTDIVGAVIQKYYSVSIGTSGFIINIIILSLGCFFFGIEPTLYTLLAFFIVFKTCNAFTDGFDYKKSIIIISDHHEAIADTILKLLARGVTYLHGEGAYTHKERQILFVVVKLTQVAKIKQIVKNIDPDAFMIIQDANDVQGRGFTLSKDHNVSPAKELSTGWQELDKVTDNS